MDGRYFGIRRALEQDGCFYPDYSLHCSGALRFNFQTENAYAKPCPDTKQGMTAQPRLTHTLGKSRNVWLAINNENSFSRDSIWEIHEQEKEMKRTKLQCLKMFQRHNWSCRGKRKGKKILASPGLLLQGHSSLLLLLNLH